MSKKNELKKQILTALEKRLGKNNPMPFTALDKKRQLVADLLYKRIIKDGKVNSENINQRIDDMFKMVKEQTSINDKIIFENLKNSFSEVSKSQTHELILMLSKISNEQTERIIKNQVKEFSIKKPEWYKEPSNEVVIKNPEVSIINPEFTLKNEEIIVSKSKKDKAEDLENISSLLISFMEGLVSFFTKLAKNTFKVRLNPEHYTTPQAVVLLDPKTMKSFDLKKLGLGDIQIFNQGGGSGGSQSGGGATDMTTTNLLLTDIKNNTDELEIKAENVNLNTDTLEALLNDIKLNTDNVEAPLSAIEAQTFGLIGNLEEIRNNTGPANDTSKTSSEDGSMNSRLRHISAKLEASETILEGIEANTSKVSSLMLKKTISISSTGTLLIPTSTKKLRVFALKFSLSADLTDVAFNFNGDADFEKYLNPKAGGLYGHSISPNYFEGGVDQELQITINGTGNVQVNIDYQELS